ncbi:Ger(x)C family spore germination protein [Oscillospiraceae bacterium WX1]
MKKQFVRKGAVIVLVISIISTLAGCWDRRELNTLGITSSIGIERKDGVYHLAIEVYHAEQPGKVVKQENKSDFLLTTGTSFFDALRNVDTEYDKKIFLYQTKELIIGDETAREGFIDVLDFWMRRYETWPNTYVLVSPEDSPAELLGMKRGSEEVTANYLDKLEENENLTGKTLHTSVSEFLRLYFDNGYALCGTILQQKDDESAPTQPRGNGGGDSAQKSLNLLKAEGSAVFSGQKLIGYLDGVETRALNLISGKLKRAVIVSPSPAGNGNNSIEVLRAGAKMEVLELGDKPRLKVVIKVRGKLVEESGTENLAMNRSVLRQIEALNSQTIKAEAEQVIKKAQDELCLDIFGFSGAVHRQHPDQWRALKERWNELFSKADVTVEVQTTIRRIGLLETPLNRRATVK